MVAGMLALLLGGGLWWWAVEHRDDCSRYMDGDRAESDSAEVKSGTRTIVVPCNVWVARQPVGVQGVYLLEGAVVLVVLVCGVGDWMKTREMKRSEER